MVQSSDEPTGRPTRRHRDRSAAASGRSIVVRGDAEPSRTRLRRGSDRGRRLADAASRPDASAPTSRPLRPTASPRYSDEHPSAQVDPGARIAAATARRSAAADRRRRTARRATRGAGLLPRGSLIAARGARPGRRGDASSFIRRDRTRRWSSASRSTAARGRSRGHRVARSTAARQAIRSCGARDRPLIGEATRRGRYPHDHAGPRCEAGRAALVAGIASERRRLLYRR